MTEPFRWKNCYADVLSNRNGDIAKSFIRDVVEPSVAALERQILDMRDRHDDPVAVFGIGPAEAVLRTTLLGYCLSIQAMWENQLRAYLRSCASELNARSAVSNKLEKAKWPELDEIFKELRGISLTAFDEYKRLNVLQLLANVCRHGTGTSLHRLASLHPELWARDQYVRPIPSTPGLDPQSAFTVDNLHISLDLLKSLAAAIDSFWQETEYIYTESIERKASSLEAFLVGERHKRTGRGKPWDP
jgi:hypothetical protein